MSAASAQVSSDDESLDSLATSSIGFDDLEEQTLDDPDSSSSNNEADGTKISRGPTSDMDVSAHSRASAINTVASAVVAEEHWVTRSRCFVISVFLLAAAFVGAATFWFFTEDQNDRSQQEVSTLRCGRNTINRDR